jgi:hypothetical protein
MGLKFYNGINRIPMLDMSTPGLFSFDVEGKVGNSESKEGNTANTGSFCLTAI